MLPAKTIISLQKNLPALKSFPQFAQIFTGFDKHFAFIEKSNRITFINPKLDQSLQALFPWPTHRRKDASYPKNF
jgi:hypothetical protein